MLNVLLLMLWKIQEDQENYVKQNFIKYMIRAGNN